MGQTQGMLQILEHPEPWFDRLVISDRPEPPTAVLADPPLVNSGDGSMDTTRLDGCRATTWASGAPKEFPVDVVGDVGFKFLEDIPEQGDILFVIAYHLPHGSSLAIEDPHPEARCGLDFLPYSEELSKVVQFVRGEHELRFGHLVGVDGGNWGECGQFIDQNSRVNIPFIETVSIVMYQDVGFAQDLVKGLDDVPVVVGILLVELWVV